MRLLLFAALSPFAILTGQAGAELHVSKAGEAPDFVGLRFGPEQAPLRLEAALTHVMPATALPDSRSARLFGEASEAGQPAADLGSLDLPATGRHLLLLSQAGSGRIRTRLLPFDAVSRPAGSVTFLNLSTRRIRCFIDGESVELAPDEEKLMPTATTARRIVNHRLQLHAKDGWKADGSTTLILGANRRFLFILQEDDPKGVLRRELVTDFDPARNLAPLVATPVKAEPPLPDPPAK